MSLFIKVINHDGVLYITAAQKLAAGSFREALHIYGMPLYPLLIALTHYVVPNWVAAARLVSVSASVFTIIPLYFLTKETFHRKAALWACCAFAILPTSNHLAVEVVRDPLFLFFLSWFIYYTYRSINSKKLIYFLFSSLLCVFSILCRIEGIILYSFYILFIFYLFLTNPQERIHVAKGLLISFSPVILFLISSFLLINMASLPSFNRMHVAIREIKVLFDQDFFDNYQIIYKRLKYVGRTLPYKAAPQNFIEITLHYMPVIYFIGLLESFIKALFPLYLIPLVVGLWNWRKRDNFFLLLLAGCYLIMSYYFLIRIDSIRVRYLLAPAFLLYPWIGIGIDRIFVYVKNSPRRYLLTILFVLFFGVLPLYSSVKIIRKQDNVLIEAGKWISTIPQFQVAEIVTNDRRVPFYAGRGLEQNLYMRPNYLAMEKFALKKGGDLLIIKASKKRKSPKPRLKKFKEVKKFVGVKNIVYIYCAPTLYKTVKGKT
jgi:4-amino-4-deoxy-L-arabinose transferase-like glycosyltransferase